MRKQPNLFRLIWIALSFLVPNRKSNKYLTTSSGLCDHESLEIFLGSRPIFFKYVLSSHGKDVIGWGRKPSGQRAVELSIRSKSNFLLLEDGFIRSYDRMDETLSLAFDNQGIYYDSNVASQIESCVSEPLSESEGVRSAEIISKWKALRVSKYNSAPEYLGPLPKPYILVIDQVAGDLSIAYGSADASFFERMLRCALLENPDATIVVKTHPDLQTNAKSGHFEVKVLEAMERVVVITDFCHPARLIENAEKIYTVTSQVGFEALVWGKPVRCFGMPFYAGWGLTVDDLPAPPRRKPVRLSQLVYGSLVKYPRYFDPERKKETEVEWVMDYIALRRNIISKFPTTIYALGFSVWKKQILEKFLCGSNLIFVKDTASIPEGATVAIWGNDVPKELNNSNHVLRVEDGFLRSSGLGADLIQPLSWVIDDQGIYYDASRPSRLESVLLLEQFNNAVLQRASKLKKTIISNGISKYNLARVDWERPPGKKKVILVPGQVEADASLRYGSPRMRSNIELLKRVRWENPDAYIVYKPHPDVTAGLRKAGKSEECASKYCDEIVENVDAASILVAVDEVHTMTSLIGFEALMRGVAVTCYGQPFYAGWGLTEDIFPIPRRTRKLSINELISGALIVYPLYISNITNTYTSPERVVEELAQWRESSPSRMPLWRRSLRMVYRLWGWSGLRSNF